MWAAGLVGCLRGRGWPRVFLALREAIGVLWVRARLVEGFSVLRVGLFSYGGVRAFWRHCAGEQGNG